MQLTMDHTFSANCWHQAPAVRTSQMHWCYLDKDQAAVRYWWLRKCIRVCWRGACCRRSPMVPTVVHISHLIWVCRIPSAWHFEQLGAVGRRKKNTLQEDYVHSMPSLLQECVMLHLLCECEGKWKSLCVEWFARVHTFIIANMW